MAKLSMATPLPDLDPTIFFQQFDEFPNLHFVDA